MRRGRHRSVSALSRQTRRFQTASRFSFANWPRSHHRASDEFRNAAMSKLPVAGNRDVSISVRRKGQRRKITSNDFTSRFMGVNAFTGGRTPATGWSSSGKGGKYSMKSSVRRAKTRRQFGRERSCRTEPTGKTDNDLTPRDQASLSARSRSAGAAPSFNF